MLCVSFAVHSTTFTKPVYSIGFRFYGCGKFTRGNGRFSCTVRYEFVQNRQKQTILNKSRLVSVFLRTGHEFCGIMPRDFFPSNHVYGNHVSRETHNEIVTFHVRVKNY